MSDIIDQVKDAESKAQEMIERAQKEMADKLSKASDKDAALEILKDELSSMRSKFDQETDQKIKTITGETAGQIESNLASVKEIGQSRKDEAVDFIVKSL